MRDLDDRLRDLDGVRVDDVWPDVRRRTARSAALPPERRSTRIVAAVAAMAVFVAVVGVLGWSLGREAHRSSQTTVQGVLPDTGTGSLPALLAMDFVDARTGFLVRCAASGSTTCGRTELLVTTDGGRTWHHRADGVPDRIAFVSATDGFGIAPCADTCPLQVERTSDGGRTWTAIASPRAGGWKVGSISFADADNGWVSTERGIWATSDGGRTWAAIDVPCGRVMRFSDAAMVGATAGFAVCEEAGAGPFAPKMILGTVNGGQSWQIESRVSLAGHGTDVGRISAIGYDSRLRFVTPTVGFLLTDRGGVAETTDGGRTFRAVASTDDAYSPVDVAWLAGGRLELALASGQVLTTSDGGSTWRQTFPTPSLGVGEPFAFASVNDGVALGSMGIALTADGRNVDLGFGLYGTRDGGRTWAERSSLQRAPLDLTYASTNVLYATVSVVPRHVLERSTDGGRTWTRFEVPRGWAPTWVDARTGFMATPSGVVRTSDGGATWRRVSGRVLANVQAASPSVLWGQPADPSGRPTGGVVRSDDGGRTWTDVGPGGTFSIDGIAVLDPWHVWLQGFACADETGSPIPPAKLAPGGCARSGRAVLLRTTDGGSSWQTIELPHLLDLRFVTPNVGYAFGVGLLRTDDAGRSWHTVRASPSP